MDMILSGRSVDAEEAHHIGLANYRVPEGKALEEAIKYAKNISRFPQICMQTDRNNVINQWGMSLSDALSMEAENGLRPIQEESIKGATRFSSGKGRNGNATEI